MQQARFSTLLRTGVLAGSLLVLPLTMPTSAQVRETPTAPGTERVVTVEERDNTGLWGLLGLVGLAGLAGLRRRHPDTVREYDQPRARV